MIKVQKNLFELAEDYLIYKKNLGEIESYDLSDIIEIAIKGRRYLDIKERNKKVAQNRWSNR